ncbi:hypothetical protein MNB_SM-7-992 [hydrothermal vent metagenome]|uniref:Prepilin-type N-terminal cleavage/methylation domain-containing protein n=1 Tax=hydrothermal vent metagenome TaxID=652676 RepID=A0A1W1BKC5_9ZZZZ
MQRAFTLIELILVVVIMGVVYMFAIGSLETIKRKSQNTLPTLANLKAFLLAKDFEKEARFVCFEGCSSCSVVLDGNVTQSLSTLFDVDPKIYRYNSLLGMEQVELDPYFDANGVQKDLCFSYRIYRDGIGDQIFVEYKDRVYDFSDYFEDEKVYDSLDSLLQKRESLVQKVLL